jgi:hypothetical protein
MGVLEHPRISQIRLTNAQLLRHRPSLLTISRSCFQANEEVFVSFRETTVRRDAGVVFPRQDGGFEPGEDGEPEAILFD